MIIPCQEDGILLAPTLKSIFQNSFSTKDFEVLLVRNNDICVSKHIHDFPLVDNHGSFNGQAQAINWGTTQAHGDIICLTKPGCIVAHDWLWEIAQFFEHHEHVDGVGGPVLPCLEYGTKIQKLASQIFYEEQEFPKKVSIPKLGSYKALLHGTNCAFRKDVLNSVKFDELFCYDYDFDACWKMLQRGNRLMFNPEMKVRCIFPLSLHNILRRYYIWGKENVILRRKYPSQKGLKAHFYVPYNTVRSFLQPSDVSTKKLLKFVQHLSFNLGCISGYGGTQEA